MMRKSYLLLFIGNRSKTQEASHMHSINIEVRFTSVEYTFSTCNVIATTEDRLQYKNNITYNTTNAAQKAANKMCSMLGNTYQRGISMQWSTTNFDSTFTYNDQSCNNAQVSHTVV